MGRNGLFLFCWGGGLDGGDSVGEAFDGDGIESVERGAVFAFCYAAVGDVLELDAFDALAAVRGYGDLDLRGGESGVDELVAARSRRAVTRFSTLSLSIFLPLESQLVPVRVRMSEVAPAWYSIFSGSA